MLGRGFRVLPLIKRSMRKNIHEKIREVNDALLDAGHNWSDIENIWMDALQEVKKKNPGGTFIRSDRAKKLSGKIKREHGIELEPKIRRRYNDPDWKFEMKGLDGGRYYFAGLVEDFLPRSAKVSLNGNCFELEEL